MADLSLSQMLTLLADNLAGQISAQDVQDVVTALAQRTDGTNPLAGLQFDTTVTAPAHTTGHLRWNQTADTLEFDATPTGVTLQIGQEQWVRVRNTTGSTISNGRAVKITGATGNRPLVSLDDGEGMIIGIATHDIANNSNGVVTTFGLVRDLDTSSFTEGDRLYSSSTGTLTTSVTSSIAGTVANVHATQGTVLAHALSLDVVDDTTANRPTTVSTGFMYFDTTLGQPIWWDGAQWVDATGATA